MDLGIFRRSKAVFSLWVILPLVTVVTVDAGSAGFCYWAKRRLAENRELLRTIGDLSDSTRAVSESLAKVLKNDEGLPATTEEISSWLDNITPQSKFTVETLSVVKSNGSAATTRLPASKKRKGKSTSDDYSAVPYISVTLKGSGSYLSLIKFLRSLESEHLMVRVSGLRVRAEGHEKANMYICDLTFNVYLVEG